MSQLMSFNLELQNKNKQAFNYSDLLKNSPKNKIVNLNWKKEFSQNSFTDTDGFIWVGSSAEVSLDSFGNGDYSIQLINKETIVSLDVTSISNDWKKNLDFAIYQISLSNMGSVYYEPKHGFADLYLVPKNKPLAPNIAFIYGNIFVQLSLISESAKDLNVLAQSIIKLASLNLLDKTETKTEEIFSLKSDRSEIQKGDSITITVTGLATDWKQHWKYNYSLDSLGENFMCTDRKEGQFVFLSTQKGLHEIVFSAVNVQNLQVYKNSIKIDVK